jgi:hypothetical protein
MMMGSGKQLEESLELLRARSSHWLRWHITRILNALQTNPGDYDSAFAKGLMPPAIRARITSLRASSKGFDEVLNTLGSTEVVRLERSIKTSAAAVSVGITGALVGIAVYLSIGLMTISTAISNEADPAKQMRRRMERSAVSSLAAPLNPQAQPQALHTHDPSDPRGFKNPAYAKLSWLPPLRRGGLGRGSSHDGLPA